MQANSQHPTKCIKFSETASVQSKLCFHKQVTFTSIHSKHTFSHILLAPGLLFVPPRPKIERSLKNIPREESKGAEQTDALNLLQWSQVYIVSPDNI